MDNNIKKIDEFLCIARELLDSNLFDLVPRKKNIDSIKSSGLTIKHVKNIIRKLSHETYYRGPTTDFGYGREGYVWEFGYNVDDIEFYIKLKIEERMGRQYLICLSFHIAEYHLSYPYGGVEKW
ncbi:MAG: type II toxin-antitoxin system MqsR family toxin [Tepidanaerobacteraceae bacterium]|nr:type II toxin-antitoxin system MqsR family toxin [Tepidanaerobacteraceae bacterium]